MSVLPASCHVLPWDSTSKKGIIRCSPLTLDKNCPSKQASSLGMYPVCVSDNRTQTQTLAREETTQGGDTMHRGSPRIPGMVPSTSLLKTELGKSHPESGVPSEPQMSSPVNSQVNRRGRSHERGRRPKSASRASPTAHITVFEF